MGNEKEGDMSDDVSDELMRRIQKWCFGGNGAMIGAQIDYVPSIAAMLLIGDAAYIIVPAARECEEEARNLCVRNKLEPLKREHSWRLLALVRADQVELWKKIVQDFQRLGEGD